MNYYVLFCQTLKTERVCQMMNRKEGIHAFIPRMESYVRVKDEVVLKVMFPGYLFIETMLDQGEFRRLLMNLNVERDGIIKELRKEDVSALKEEEIQLMQGLLNHQGILKMSEGYKKDGKTFVTKGPLCMYEDEIVDSNKRDMYVVLNIKMLNQNVKAGLMFK